MRAVIVVLFLICYASLLAFLALIAYFAIGLYVEV